MRHPCDGVASKQFDAVHPDFAENLCNVRLGLCSDPTKQWVRLSGVSFHNIDEGCDLVVLH